MLITASKVEVNTELKRVNKYIKVAFEQPSDHLLNDRKTEEERNGSKMPRKKTKSLVRDIAPDRKYNNVRIQRLINRVMLNGKKQLAEKIVYEAMDKAAVKLKSEDPLESLNKALDAVKPAVETRSRRVGGANYQIPFEVRGQRQMHLTLMWFVAAARARKGMPMADRIAAEIVDACNGTGAAVKKREDTHKMAESNRAFAHFARN